MNLRKHKRRAVAGMARRRSVLVARSASYARRASLPDDLYPRLHWRVQPWRDKARSGKRPTALADHHGYRPRPR